MKSGLLMQQTFNLKSPTLQKELDSFVRQLGERMKQHKVEQYVGLRRFKTDDLLEILVIPCSPQSGKLDATSQQLINELQGQGFESATFQDAGSMTSYSQSDIEPIGIKFGE